MEEFKNQVAAANTMEERTYNDPLYVRVTDAKRDLKDKLPTIMEAYANCHARSFDQVIDTIANFVVPQLANEIRSQCTEDERAVIGSGTFVATIENGKLVLQFDLPRTAAVIKAIQNKYDREKSPDKVTSITDYHPSSHRIKIDFVYRKKDNIIFQNGVIEKLTFTRVEY